MNLFLDYSPDNAENVLGEARIGWRGQLRLNFSQPLAALSQIRFRIKQAKAVEILDALAVIRSRALELFGLLGASAPRRIAAFLISKEGVDVAELRALAPSLLVTASFCVGDRFGQPLDIVHVIGEDGRESKIRI